MIRFFIINTVLLGITLTVQSQPQKQQGDQPKMNDSNTPLHLLQPDYVTPYRLPVESEIKSLLDRIFNYLDPVTPARLTDKTTGEQITRFEQINENSVFERGEYRLTSYEWGVTYAGMLLATEVTNDQKFAGYTFDRLRFLSEIRPYFLAIDQQKKAPTPVQSILHPHALDDAGAVCAAMIKAKQAGLTADLNPMIDNFIEYISHSQFRLSDGTLARNRPLKNSLWLDDLFMSVPALAQMGLYSGQSSYFDDAVRQVLNFSQRMFNTEKGLFMHGWIESMNEHPQFHWARANGWAIMTMVELLEVLPANYQGREQVLGLLRKHVRGLAAYQSQDGFWHQLIDKNETYNETSATAIYTYAIARAINRGYVEASVYGPMVCLAWNAVATQVNDKGQVEGTCVGTGMGFDPAFYYYRPVSPYAAHGYGPVLLAGAEMIRLLRTSFPKMNDSAIMFYPETIDSNGPIFEVR